MVASIKSSLSLADGFNALHRQQRNQEELQLAEVTQEMTDRPSPETRQIASSSSIMASNFTSVERSESKYTQAMITRLKSTQQTENNKQNTLMSILQQATMEYESAGTTGEKYKALARARQNIFSHQQNEIRKSAEETHLKESKEKLDEKIKEGLTATDENGNPIEGQAESENAGEAAPMPEIADTSQNSAPDSTIESSQNGQVLAPPADAHVSNDTNTPPDSPAVAAAPSVNLIV